MKPILRDFPEQFETSRLLIRAPRFGDGEKVRAAVEESFENLRPWMPWAQTIPTIEDEEEFMRAERLKFLARENLMLLLVLKGTDTLVGCSGLHGIDWQVPKFEIGYWIRKKFEGQGYMSEAVDAITRFAFHVLSAERVEIRVDDNNSKSWRIPERLGFVFEGTLRNDARDVQGNLRDTRLYAQIRSDKKD